MVCEAGLPLGVTMMIATSPFSLKTGSEAAATPGNSASALAASSAIALGLSSPRKFSKSITVVSGPVKPGPNPLVRRS